MTNEYPTGCGSVPHFVKISDLAEPIAYIYFPLGWWV